MVPQTDSSAPELSQPVADTRALLAVLERSRALQSSHSRPNTSSCGTAGSSAPAQPAEPLQRSRPQHSRAPLSVTAGRLDSPQTPPDHSARARDPRPLEHSRPDLETLPHQADREGGKPEEGRQRASGECSFDLRKTLVRVDPPETARSTRLPSRARAIDRASAAPGECSFT